MYRVVHGSAPTYLTELCQPCSDTRLRSTSRGDFIVPRFNRQLSNSSFSVAAPSAWNRLPSHIRTSSIYTLFLTRLKTHLFAESLLWHCYAVVFSLYFWHPRALDVGRHSKFMLIDWLIDYKCLNNVKWKRQTGPFLVSHCAAAAEYTRRVLCSDWADFVFHRRSSCYQPSASYLTIKAITQWQSVPCSWLLLLLLP